MCSNIKPEQWFNHFKDLLNSDANLANDFSVHVNDENNMHSISCDTCDANEPDILNHDISKDEIRMVTKNLPTGKSPGIEAGMRSLEHQTHSVTPCLFHSMYSLGLSIIVNAKYTRKYSYPQAV